MVGSLHMGETQTDTQAHRHVGSEPTGKTTKKFKKTNVILLKK